MNSNFEMDAQSYDDLSIFGKNDGMFSIFEYYCRSRIIGGRQRMAEIMRNPSNNPVELIERRNSIQFFIGFGVDLGIDYHHFDLIIHYLKFGGVRVKDNLIDSYASFLKNKVNPSQDYYNVNVGIKYLLPLLALFKD
jgi:DNA mismatch repair protein MutS